MKSSCITTLILIITHLKLVAQGEIKIEPPNPESSSIFKFAEVPVSTYTGLPNVTLPIYEIRLKGITIPIQMSYHARGIKVEEIAPRVGLGWALSYGGVISRQIRDKPDDDATGFLNQNYYNSVFTDSNIRGSMHSSILNGGVDTTPDQFYYEMNGVSGKFLFDQATKSIMQQKFSDIKISYTTGQDGIDSWILMDENGNKFYYGKSKDRLREALDYDQLINNYNYSRLSGISVLGNEGDDRNINSWHLMEIETPFGENVQFHYEEEISSVYRRLYDKTDGSDVFSNFSHYLTHQHQIKEIIVDFVKVVFIPSSTDREDLEGGHVLNKVVVSQESSELFKEFIFEYFYTTSSENNNQLSYLRIIDPKSNKRLFLNSIQEKGLNGKSIPPYLFSYDPVILPNRFSNSQDCWGYYNGENNGEYLTFFNYANKSVNRNVNISVSGAGILSKIKYPMGGSVTFTYEHNIAKPPEYMSELLFPKIIKTETKSILDGFLKNPLYYSNGIYSKSITISDKKIGNITFSVDLPYCSGPIQDSPSYCQYQIYLIGQGINYYLYPPENSRTLDIPAGVYSLEVIPPADHDPSDPANFFNVKLEWDEVVTSVTGGTTNPTAPILGSGKRIKKIEYETDEGIILSKEYEYLGADGQTSGRIFGLPNFYYITKQTSVGPILDPYGSMPGSPLTNLQGNSIGYSTVTEYHGKDGIYNGKTEFEFTITEDGGNYYSFPFHPPTDNEWLRGKSLSSKFYEINNSIYSLKKEIVNNYLYAGNSLTPGPFVQPLLPEGAPFTNNKTRANFYLPLLVFTSETLAYKTFFLTGGTMDLHTRVENIYENNSLKLTKETKFTYNYQNHYNLQAIESQLSDGTKEIQITTYPNDFPFGTPFIDSMKDKNILNYPIEQVKYINKGGVNTILSGIINKYNLTNPALPEQVLSLENAYPIPVTGFKFSNREMGVLPPYGTSSVFSPFNQYRVALTYDLNDLKGNNLQITKANDITNSYIWDYKNRFVVAEVKNAYHSDIAYTSFESDGKGNWIFTGVPLQDDSSPTGKFAYNLSAGSITKPLNNDKSYVLTYWAKANTSPEVSGSAEAVISTPQQTLSVNSWNFYTIHISNSTTIEITGNVLVDEIRLHPIGAFMKTYTYDPLKGITSSSDENSLTTYYLYDELNRLKTIKDKDRNTIHFYQYKFAE